jgi:hypothetical protein
MQASPQAGELSGPAWVARFPTSRSVDDLAQPFSGHARRFLAALDDAGASVSIAATLRPPNRAFLMHYAWVIARESFDPASVPARAGVSIRWLHTDTQGRPDVPASRRAAQRMVDGYQIVHRPSLESRHTQGLAIDMNITWNGTLTIADAQGHAVAIAGVPRTVAGNSPLQTIGASYGVHKLRTDPPHWSSDGH